MDLTPTVALDRLATVLVQGERLTVVALDGVADLEHRELFALDGAGSAVGWLRQQRFGGDPRLRALARQLADRPVVRQALLDGRLGTDTAATVCRALAQVPADAHENDLVAVLTDGAQQALLELTAGGATTDDLTDLANLSAVAVAEQGALPTDRLEAVFVFLAERLVPATLARTLRDLVEAVVPMLLGEPTEDGYDSYGDEFLDLQPALDGHWHVRGLLSPETGQALDAELTRRLEDHPAHPGIITSVGKRRALALGDLARDGAAHGRSGHDGAGNDRPAADLTIIIRHDTLIGASGALPAQLGDGTRIPVNTARRLGCDGRLAAVILDAHQRPLRASGTHRNAIRRERRALHARWHGCAVDGCAAPYSQTRPHHVIPWWLSKITRLDDLAPLCPHHHHDIHEGQRTLRLRDQRRIGPTGWVT